MPVVLETAAASGSDDLSQGAQAGSAWSLSLDYDVNAALIDAGVDFDFGATKLEIAIDNTLFAASEVSSGALIAKKDFVIDVGSDPFDPNPNGVPEPTSLALTGLSLCGLGAMVRHHR
ncbi:MAG: PEP-CTERM sorting domain-containing protein [Aeoliella sp.]